MSSFIEIDNVDKVFGLPDGGEYIALKNIDLKIQKGEFISLIGHSGCGKSTLLNIIAGLYPASTGGVVLEGKEVVEPGPERMVVFQNYSLLPWLTVRQNIALAVNRVFKDRSDKEKRTIVNENISLVGLRHAANKRPEELSGGMKQRVAIARALAIKPKVLLLDEPFGALDALTRGNLQEKLMEIVQENQVTCVMVTHDVDEALLLSDRVVMLTTGPQAHIGQILEVPMARPRKRLEVVNHPQYYTLRNEIVYFLNQQKRSKKVGQVEAKTLEIKANGLEKINLDIGFIPLSDCAPLIIAKEKGFFKAHGLEEVNLVREPSWKEIANGVATGRLDAAQMVAGMPFSMTLGVGGAGVQTAIPIVTALVLSRNGNAITLSKTFAEMGVSSLEELKQALNHTPDKVHNFGMVHPSSMHNLMLRYWLASGGIDPDLDVNLMVIPPPQMVSNLKAGNIDGYCVGEPWNSRAVLEDLGYVIATDFEIWPGHPEKVLGVKEDWIASHPNTHIALVKALIEACEYCDDRRNREEILELLTLPDYVGVQAEYIRPGLVGPFSRNLETEPESLLRFHQFYVDHSNCPGRAEGLWILTQLARWGYIPFPRNWIEILERVRRPDLFGTACRQLGIPHIEPDRQNFELFDKMVFSPDDPIGYLERFSITRDYQVAEILIDDNNKLISKK